MLLLEIKDIVRDPIYGYIRLTALELKIINTKIFQRLRFIKQTPGVSYVYPGGVNTRFLHSLGACHLAGRIGEEIKLGERELQTVRLAALLHDIGHGPFSHVFDDFLEKRGVVIDDGKPLTHENIGSKILENSNIKRILKESKYKFRPEEIIQIAWGEKSKEARPPNYEVKRGIIAGWFDVDRLDFITRDAYFCGVEYGALDVERIVSNLKIFRNNLTLRKRAVWAFEHLYIQRWNMFRAVYFHRTGRAWETQLLETLLILDNKLNISEKIRKMFIVEKTKKRDYIDWILLREDTLLSQLLILLETEEYKNYYDDPEILYRHLMGVVHRDREHLIRSIMPFETEDLLGTDLSRLEETAKGVKRDIATEANKIIGPNKIDSEKHLFIDTPQISNIPTVIKPKGAPPILNDEENDFWELPATSQYNKLDEEITFSFIFTFPEHVKAIREGYNKKFSKVGQTSHY